MKDLQLELLVVLLRLPAAVRRLNLARIPAKTVQMSCDRLMLSPITHINPTQVIIDFRIKNN